MKKLYIIAGPNGAGKTTVSFTILPEIFECAEFVNADEIARGISPFNPDKVAIQAGKIMLKRINELLEIGETFAIETTLSAKYLINFIKNGKKLGYEVILLFLLLESDLLAIKRVKTRVKEGGHNISIDVIKRRYKKGLENLFQSYIPIVDKWFLIDNSGDEFNFIAEGINNKILIKNEDIWFDLKGKYNAR